MNKEFIPYEQALELKELGFKKDNDFGLLYKGEDIPSILYQQAFRWFREKHTLASQIHPIESSGQFIWQYLIRNLSEYLTEFDLENFIFDTYEEAELACLKKLIEIVKQK